MQKHSITIKCDCKTATHAWCERCLDTREVEFQAARRPRKGVVDLQARYQGGELVCKACQTVLVRLYRKVEPGADRNHLSLVQSPLEGKLA